MELYFVLNRPIVPENIGSAARAIGTMGWSRLRLVNPCSHLQDRARWMATHSTAVLEGAQVFEELPQALSDLDFSVATTARNRKRHRDALSPRALAEALQEKSDSASGVALVFGPEDCGLSNSELALCDVVSAIPTSGSHASLNLAQAVMIYAYELSIPHPSRNSDGERKFAKGRSQKALQEKFALLLEWLELPEENPVRLRLRRRLALLRDADVRLAHFLVNAALRKLGRE